MRKNMYNALLDSYEKYLVAAKRIRCRMKKGKVKSKYLKDIRIRLRTINLISECRSLFL